jgi:hypothetical protein
MVDELIEMMKLDLIKFPKEYSGNGSVTLSREKDGEVEIYTKSLSFEEEIALINVDLLKTETTSIHEFKNAEGTNKTYKMPKDKENTMHDDRFYTLIMISHYLSDLRRKNIVEKKKPSVSLEGLSCVSSVNF